LRLVIHAPNVHVGGGAILLKELLCYLKDLNEVWLILDSRLVAGLKRIPEVRVTSTIPTVAGRIAADFRLRRGSRQSDTVLCFGNLPPLFGARGKIWLFLQNRYLLNRLELKGFPLRQRLRIGAERVWIRSRISVVSELIVQTPSMAEMAGRLGIPVSVMPFSPVIPASSEPATTGGENGPGQNAIFLYVASGEPHKNHRGLVKSWVELAKSGIRPKLILTVGRERHPELCGWIDSMCSRYELDIENLGTLSRDRLFELYKRSTCLIYPSFFESMGLPLVEARELGLPIIAAERDYVRDVVEPVQTFDPESSVSIARSVRRFLCRPEPCVRLLDGADFIQEVMRR